MRLVVDSNVLFTSFWKTSVFHALAKSPLELASPAYAKEEISCYRGEIMEKAGLSEKEFSRGLDALSIRVRFVPKRGYAPQIKPAMALLEHLPPHERGELLDDIDFISLALSENCPLWSNDKLLKKQLGAIVLTTRELILLLGREGEKQDK